MPAPRLIAHRGYPRHYPENSLTGIQAALDAGARYVEFDVQLCADGVPVVCHDPDLGRTGQTDVSILDHPWAELAHLSVGEPQRFGNRFTDSLLPTLAEVAARVVAFPDVTGLVELKTESVERFGAAFVLSRILEVLDTDRDRFIFISFSPVALAAARNAGIPRIGWVLSQWNDASRVEAETLTPEFLICNYKKLPPAPEPLWPGPWRWALYEVDEPELALALGARGAAFVETFSIGELLREPALRAANAGVS